MYVVPPLAKCSVASHMQKSVCSKAGFHVYCKQRWMAVVVLAKSWWETNKLFIIFINQ